MEKLQKRGEKIRPLISLKKTVKIIVVGREK